MSEWVILLRPPSGQICFSKEGDSPVTARIFPDCESAELQARGMPSVASGRVEYRIAKVPVSINLDGYFWGRPRPPQNNFHSDPDLAGRRD
jgi:hypothetical protein